MQRRTALSCVFALGLLALPPRAEAKVQTKEVTYTVGEKTFKGLLAWDDAVTARRPGVLVVHEWWGLNDYAKERARKIAGLGYVGMAVDMFGDGKVATHPAEAGEMATAVRKDPEGARARFLAARRVLEGDAHVDPKRIGAIGYCFGGTTVLEMARAGVDLAGVVSFHGHLAPLDPAATPKVTAKVLVCNGASDPMSSRSDVAAFEEEMTKAGADWQLIDYGGAKHSFTNPGADKAGMEQLAYHPAADRRSWEAMTAFLREALGK